MMSVWVTLIVEGTFATLLLATLVLCIRLELRLRALRRDKESLSGTVRALNAAIAGAQASLAGLRTAAREADDGLGRKVSLARALADELSLLTAAGERIASRMESAGTRRPVPGRAQPGPGEALRGLR